MATSAIQFLTTTNVGGVPTVQAKNIYTSGSVFWVDSNNGLDTNSGLTSDAPLQTIAAAVALATSNTHDLILCKPNHAETFTTATALTINKEGVEIVSLGSGDNRAVLTIGSGADTAAGINVAADNVTLDGVVFSVGVDATEDCINTTNAYTTIKNCEFYEGSAKQWVTAIHLSNAAADNCTIHNCRFVSKTAGATSAINIGAAVDNLEIGWNYIDGDFATAALTSASVFTNAFIHDNYVGNDNAGDWAIEFTAACTGALTNNRLYSDNVATMLDPGSLKCLGNRGVTGIDENDFGIPAGAVASDMSQIYSDSTIIASDLVIVGSDLLLVYSDTTIIASDLVKIYSDTTVCETGFTGTYSDTTIIASDLVIVGSDLLLVYSDTTIIASDLVLVYSDTTIIYSDTTIIASDLVIVGSDLLLVYSDTTIIYSDTTIIYSDTTIIASDLVIVQSDLLQVYSDSTIIASDLVIIASDLLQVYSDTSIIYSDTTIIYSDTTLISSDTAAIEGYVKEIGGTVAKTGTFNDNTLTNNTQVVTLATATGGDVLIEKILIGKDAAALTGPTNLELSVNNVYGNTGADDPVCAVAVASVTANSAHDGASMGVLALVPFVLESTKALFAHGSDAAGTSAGAIKYAVMGRRLAAGATLA